MEVSFAENAYATVTMVQFLFAVFALIGHKILNEVLGYGFYGMVFAPITGLFLLAKNGKSKSLISFTQGI